MQRLAYFIALCSCLALEGSPVIDEPLSKEAWTQFGPLCKYYVMGRKEKPDAVYAILKSYVSPNATILDLGSGTGISTRQLYRNGFKNIIGIDRDPMMIKEAQRANTPSCLIKYIQGDIAMGLPFPDEQFDVVVASSSFHWFSNPSSIKEVERLLKPNGYYFVVGGKSRYQQQSKKPNPLKENLSRIMGESAGVRPHAPAPAIADVLEEEGLKIIVDATVPYVTYYTKQEFLHHVQSQSCWNLVKESQRSLLLKKVDAYVDTILDEEGRVKKEGNIAVILAQKIKSSP